MTVVCVRCNATVPAARADVVGTGYRCDQCSLQAEVTEGADATTDHVEPAERERLAKQGKTKFMAAMGIAGTILATPTLIGYAVGGPLFAVLGAVFGIYGGGQVIGTATETYYTQWKRYGKTPQLPAARIRGPR